MIDTLPIMTEGTESIFLLIIELNPKIRADSMNSRHCY